MANHQQAGEGGNGSLNRATYVIFLVLDGKFEDICVGQRSDGKDGGTG